MLDAGAVVLLLGPAAPLPVPDVVATGLPAPSPPAEAVAGGLVEAAAAGQLRAALPAEVLAFAEPSSLVLVLVAGVLPEALFELDAPALELPDPLGVTEPLPLAVEPLPVLVLPGPLEPALPPA